jgi:hypothetical protein
LLAQLSEIVKYQKNKSRQLIAFLLVCSFVIQLTKY